jgi:DNA modification methylase
VLDPFGGSGTTMIAAERTGRKAALLELDPRYVDVIVERWQAETGRDAILDGDGRTFAAVKAERPGSPADDEREPA